MIIRLPSNKGSAEISPSHLCRNTLHIGWRDRERGTYISICYIGARALGYIASKSHTHRSKRRGCRTAGVRYVYQPKRSSVAHACHEETQPFRKGKKRDETVRVNTFSEQDWVGRDDGVRVLATIYILHNAELRSLSNQTDLV